MSVLQEEHSQLQRGGAEFVEELQRKIAELDGDLAKTKAERDLAVEANVALLVRNDTLRLHLGAALESRIEANDICSSPADYNELGLRPPPHLENGLTGTNEAINLLRRVQEHGKPATVDVSDRNEARTSSAHSPHLTTGGESPRADAKDTPSRQMSTPTGIRGRFSSAIKSLFGFSTSSNAPAPAPAQSPTPSRAPPPDTYTETLSIPPTPVGESRITREPINERKRRGRRVNPSPMLRLLIRGVPTSDTKAATEWAKQVLPELKNDAAYEEKRKRLETPVLLKDLMNLPSHEPWATGYGDPLEHLDEEDVVPVWAVYMDMVTEAEQPEKKRTKTSHEGGMDVEDTPSLNDTFCSGEPTTPFDSHGTSASIYAINPRSSREPSPMFPIVTSQPQGDNIFRKSHEGNVDASGLANKKSTPHHNPAQGSFGLDYDSDDDDSSLISETTEADAGASPVWTQPPPPAPTPAHAPLPGGVPGEQQPVDEIERQRQKLMKHTPAKPSRLREAFVPSPAGSLLSEVGNGSVHIGSPLPGGDPFGDMPEAESLDLDDDVKAGLPYLAGTAEWKAAIGEQWADPVLTYDSEEEALSPADV